ncbi:hypothetical protein BCR33DRAFT_718513 [Rhizoclosmatium globosum]|uniref:Uncharacterized protein n=1 Tax=Rhizoclosmatium globosum TaxID=329046 RepID=A0A1Y2C5S0_9FUNG|nr:hypothetical protein BCR33DRAFT_721747 [Rhizoclosmatium globosum]ORY42390.1 hypothetical protein BCR33DRAFT_718513 [Rhizoclosmatium globosum]|eukprot:ORY36808.1 hypothetical protein BCR33DRAFT_721747 [Rhizoclosmatium globosum]
MADASTREPSSAGLAKRQSTKSSSIISRLIPQQTDDITVKWARYALVSVLVVTFLCAGAEIWIMVEESIVKNMVLDALVNDKTNFDAAYDAVWVNFRVGLTYHSVFLASIIFWLGCTWDGLLNKNIMQCFGINAYNVGILVYSLLQIKQTSNDFDRIADNWVGFDKNYYNSGYFLAAQILLPCLIGVFIPLFAYLTYRMFLEFGWRQYRITGGNKQLEKVIYSYHILLLLLKFALFFVTAFTVLDLALTTVTDRGKYVISIVGGIFGVLLTAAGFYGARRENGYLLSFYIFGCCLVIGYLIERVYEAYNRSLDVNNESDYKRAELPFLLYAALSALLVIASIVFGVVSYTNFGKGLKDVLDQEQRRKDGELPPQEIDLDA